MKSIHNHPSSPSRASNIPNRHAPQTANMHIKRPRIPFFRIFYSTTFTILTLIVAAGLLITPGDHIYQSFRSGQIYHIFIVAGFYLLTFVVSLLIYGGRLYKTRTILAGIPREGFDVGGKVEREIQNGLERTVVIAYESHPRDLKDEKAARGIEKRTRLGRSSIGRQSQDSMQSYEPAWGVISHPGWSSPSSPDLPNLHYEPVIIELSNIVEAKAVSLAPPDPLYVPETKAEEQEAPMPDYLAVELLQRPATMGLRVYISHLSDLGMIEPISLGTEFLFLYERARFSGEALNEADFRDLMAIFAEILRNMKPLDTAIVDELHAEMEEAMSSSSSSSVSDKASLATNDTVRRTPQPDVHHTASSSASTSSKGSAGTMHTTPCRPEAAKNISNVSKTSRLTRPSQGRGINTLSLSSMKRERKNISNSGYSAGSAAGSVIRLAEARSPLDLPYTFHALSTEEV